MTLLTVDHLVVAARTLAEGADWCEAALGVRPAAGGRHVFMGTHNLVMPVSSPRFPRSYLEIIAIDPGLPAPPRARWFDLDDAALQRQLRDGPALVHWVARCDDLDAARAALRAGGLDPGPVTEAERMTPTGLLRWRIALRADGVRPAAGAAPALIAWSGPHPTDDMASSGIMLESLAIGAAAAPVLALAPQAECSLAPAAPALSAVLATARGRVTLSSPPA